MPTKSKKKRAAANQTNVQEKVVPKPTPTHPASTASVSTLGNTSKWNANTQYIKRQDVKATPHVPVNKKTAPPANEPTESKIAADVGTKKLETQKLQKKPPAPKLNAGTSNATEGQQKANKASAKEKSGSKISRTNNAKSSMKLSTAAENQTEQQKTTATNGEPEASTPHEKEEVLQNISYHAKMQQAVEELESKVASVLKRFPVKDEKLTINKKLAGIQRMSILENKLKALPKVLEMIQKDIIEGHNRSSETAAYS